MTPYQAAPAFHGDFFRHFSGYTRAFLKVQNGCDNACSYCVIPVARGPSRSMPLADVATQVRLLADQGFREVVLTGIHLGAWGRDTGEGSLADLLAALAGFRETASLPAEFDRAHGGGRPRAAGDGGRRASASRTTSTCRCRAGRTPFCGA